MKHTCSKLRGIKRKLILKLIRSKPSGISPCKGLHETECADHGISDLSGHGAPCPDVSRLSKLHLIGTKNASVVTVEDSRASEQHIEHSFEGRWLAVIFKPGQPFKHLCRALVKIPR